MIIWFETTLYPVLVLARVSLLRCSQLTAAQCDSDGGSSFCQGPLLYAVRKKYTKKQ